MTTPEAVLLDAAGIAARIPHAGRMGLLQSLLAWDADSLLCQTQTHRDPEHPLRLDDGSLPAAAGVEYASQAMALHGSLSAAAGAAPKAGFLAAVREVALHVPRLDTVAAPLRVQVQRLAGDAGQALYRFQVHSQDGQPLVTGRATVILDALP